MDWLFVAALFLLGLGWLVGARAKSLQRQTGLPEGRLVYADTHQQDWQAAPQPFYSATHQLVGKPDYLVDTKAGIVPVEVKSSKAPSIPYLGHILQLAAYCLLIEDHTGQRPRHGLLKYADALYEVDFTRELRAELLNTMADMRRARLEKTVARSHEQPGKCAACRFRAVCDEALDDY